MHGFRRLLDPSWTQVGAVSTSVFRSQLKLERPEASPSNFAASFATPPNDTAIVRSFYRVGAGKSSYVLRANSPFPNNLRVLYEGQLSDAGQPDN